MSTSLALTIRRSGHAPTDLVTTTDDLRAILDRADAANDLLALLKQMHAAPPYQSLILWRQSIAAEIAKAEGRI